MTRGKFITLEGIEGAGKSTVALAIADTLRARGLRVRLTREPGGTPLAERLRQLVLERGEESLSAEAETLLMFAARAIHLDNLVRPALERGEWVICDRFTDATRAYQGGGRGVDAVLIEQLALSVHLGLEPDLTLLLDVPVTIGLNRARSRRQSNGEVVTDRFESETVQFFERVSKSYLEIARREPQRCRVIDASADPDTVKSAALVALQGLPG
ncbi:MAG: dTMP kinase [Gammaproteobacteria bacterium]|nr:dTMP kinase [Gammaproteobacteria bacterium]